MGAKRNIDPAIASLRGRVAANASWAKLTPAQRVERTEAGRRAAEDRFLKQARELHPDASEEHLAAVANNLQREHFSRMALRSAVARRGGRKSRAKPVDEQGGGVAA